MEKEWVWNYKREAQEKETESSLRGIDFKTSISGNSSMSNTE